MSVEWTLHARVLCVQGTCVYAVCLSPWGGVVGSVCMGVLWVVAYVLGCCV